MKTITIYFTILILSFAMPEIQAQTENSAGEVERLEQQKEKIIAEERAALKKTVESINRQLEDQEITRAQAERMKEEAAKKHALNIENRIAIIENEIAWQTRNDLPSHKDWERKDDINKAKTYYKGYDSRTSTQLVVSAGLNNAMEEGQSINDLDFEVGGSRYFEIGLAWTTRVFDNSNWLRVRYGFSFQFNGLKPTDNRYFVTRDDLTFLEEYPIDLNKSKFRMDNLVIPLHFEFGPSRKVATDWGNWFSTAKKFKIGVGGYAGLNLGDRQKLKYSNDGERVKTKLKGDHNTNNIIYGVSSYVGWGATSLYAKYDLNPIFQEPNVALYNVSLGLRFDLD